MLRNNFRIFGRMILAVKGERADAVSSPAAPLRKGNEMFCPHCGAQQPDGAVFCGNCGQSMVGASSAPQPAPARQAPAPQQPFAAPAPAPAAHHGFGNSGSNFQGTLSAATGFGKRSLAMLGGAVASFVCMFQPWIAMPWIDKALSYAANQAGSDNYGLNQTAITSAKALVNSAFDMPHVFSLSGALRGLSTGVNNLAMQITSYDTSAAAQAQQAAGSLGLVANVLTILFVLWIACVVAMIAGVVIKFLKKQDVVLFASLGASAVLSLVCIIGALVANGQIDGALTQMLASNGGSSALAVITTIKPFLAPAYGAVLTLIFSIAGLVSAFVLKED